MLRFFRNLRLKLIPGNRLSKYLLYAIGEIFLVVIGILLALQLNTWNDNRKSRQEVEVLVDLLEKELNDNLALDRGFMTFAYHRDSLVTLVLSETVTEEQYHEQPALQTLITVFPGQTPGDEILQKLLSKEEHFPEHLHPLLPLLKTYHKQIRAYGAGNGNRIDHVVGHIEYFMNNHPWWSKNIPDAPPSWSGNDSTALAEMTDFFLHDPIYRNRVLTYASLILNNGGHRRTELRALALGLLARIHIYRTGFHSEQIRQLMAAQGMSPFPAKACTRDFVPEEPTAIFRHAFLLVNASGEKVTVYRLDERGQRIEHVELAPHEIKVSTFANLVPGETLEAEGTSTCTRYITHKNGYALLD